MLAVSMCSLRGSSLEQETTLPLADGASMCSPPRRLARKTDRRQHRASLNEKKAGVKEVNKTKGGKKNKLLAELKYLVATSRLLAIM